MGSNIVLQEALRNTGNTDTVESVGDLRISGSNKVLRLSVAHVPSAGTTQATGTALTATFNLISTATANSGVVLPSIIAQGALVHVKNSTTGTPIKVYPPESQSIWANPVNNPYVLSANQGCWFIGYSNTAWYPSLDAGVGYIG